MSLFSASVYLHLLCLLLVSGSSSTVIKKESAILPDHLNQLSSTQANCSTACDNGSVSEGAPASGVSKAGSSGVATNVSQQNLSSVSDLAHTSLINQTTSPTNVNSDDTQPLQSSPNSALFIDTTNVTLKSIQQSEGGPHSSNASSSTQQLSPNHQHPSLETATGPAAVLPFGTTHSPTQFVHSGSSASTGTTVATTAVPNRNIHTGILPVMSSTTTPPTSTTTIPPTSTPPTSTTTTPPSTPPTSTTTTPPPSSTTTPPTSTTTTPPTSTTTTPPSTPPTSTTTTAAPHPPTPVNATAKATISVITSTGTKTSSSPPQLSTGMPPIQTTSLTSGATTINVTSVVPPAVDNKPFATRGAVVEALTRQLVDTASLLAVLLFGLLFFLVTVAVFVTQAYESYRRKDYTQVDYLINGMYTDSGV